MKIADPPSGWKYGFPKVYDIQSDETCEQWLIRRGYPEKDASFGAQHMRVWEEIDD